MKKVIAILGFCTIPLLGQAAPPEKKQVLETMKRATQFLVDNVSYRGGYVWSYLPDMSRRWGELEARPTMIWIQPPGTPMIGHLFLDAYHATGDEYYYRAAQQVAQVLMDAQLSCGGWNYVFDYAGEGSLKEWYNTIGKNAWRLEEFQHYYGNATFDDQTTPECAKFMLRMFMEKHDSTYQGSLERAIQFVLTSQYAVGGWPQRYPKTDEFSHHGLPDYTPFITFNDDVNAENVSFLLLCYQALGQERFLDPIRRGMNVFVVTQQPAPQAGWALQYSLDLKPAGARTYEPKALATHGSLEIIRWLMEFYRWTSDKKFLARIPEAFDWLDRCRIPTAWNIPEQTHITFWQVGSNTPLFLHRTGSNVVNGRYYADSNHANIITHYNSYRSLPVSSVRKEYDQLVSTPAAEIARGIMFPLPKSIGLPKYFAVNEERRRGPEVTESAEQRLIHILQTLNNAGYWPTPLYYTSHPYTQDGSKNPNPGDYTHALVGDETDTSPYHEQHPVVGISMDSYLRNMTLLIQYVEKNK
jgi:PelA/Pel-15E family pectate lyase